MLKRLRQYQHPQSFLKARWVVRSAFFLILSLVLMVSLLSKEAQSQNARSQPRAPTPTQIDQFLPAPQVHALPATLSQWQNTEPQNGQQRDYFDQIQPTIAGYLIWSKFPVKIYLEPATQHSLPSGTPGALRDTVPGALRDTVPGALRDRSQEWVSAVTAAIQDWSIYLPLSIVSSPDTADIIIWRRTPPLQVNRRAGTANNSELQPELRARSAETRFTLFVDRSVPSPILSQRMTIWLGIGQTQDYLRAAARHELGHALGLWGHSPTATDVMYFSQVRQSPAISERDISTLKRIYQQPTRLGWVIPQAPNSTPNSTPNSRSN